MGEVSGNSCGVVDCTVCASSALLLQNSSATHQALLKKTTLQIASVSSAVEDQDVAASLAARTLSTSSDLKTAATEFKRPSSDAVDLEDLVEVDDIDSLAGHAMSTTLRSSNLRRQLLALAKKRGLDAKEVPSKAAIARALSQGSLTLQELEAVAGWGPHRAHLWGKVIAKY